MKYLPFLIAPIIGAIIGVLIIKKLPLSEGLKKANINAVIRGCILMAILMPSVLFGNETVRMIMMGPGSLIVIIFIAVLYKLDLNKAKKENANQSSEPILKTPVD